MEIYFICIITFIIYLYDTYLLYINKSELIRWYYLHFTANMLTCYYSIDPLIKLILDPVYHIQNPTFYNDSMIIILIIHLYHLIFFKCTNSDWVHHILFVLLGSISHYSINWGYISPFCHFFVSGLPGGIDYLNLALVKENIITKKTRLKISVELNNWIRVPGMLFSGVFAYLLILYSEKTIINIICFFIMISTSIINALFYNRQVLLYAGKHAY